MQGTSSEAKERRRILVVDKDLNMLHFLNRALDMEGFETVIVGNNAAAVNIVPELEPDMVIMDTAKTDAEALDTVGQIREHSNVPIVILTSDNEIETLKEALSRGADDFIRKPFGTRLFLARIKAKLRRYPQEMRP